MLHTIWKGFDKIHYSLFLEAGYMHWIDRLTPPVIIGHRGASKYAPENTMAAFNLALHQGADAIELDVMLTADNVPVVMHDSTVDRTTNGIGRVDNMTWEELKNLDAGTSFSAAFSGEKIPLLEEVFSTFKNEVLINIELKNYHAPKDQLPEMVVDLARRMNMIDQVFFSSFLPSNLKKIRLLIPDARVALLCLGGLSGLIGRSFLFSSISPEYINPNYKDVTDSFLWRQKLMHRKVNAWTVNDKDDLKDLIKRGIFGIITDDPKTASLIKTEMK